MGANTRPKNRKTMSQKDINRLMKEKPATTYDALPVVLATDVVKQNESDDDPTMDMDIPEDFADLQVEKKPIRPLLHNKYEYDTMDPEGHIREFCAYVRSCLARYEYDQAELAVTEQKLQDLMHFAEMSEDKKSRAGYKLYKEITAARRQRRAYKSEIDLLYPMHSLFHGTKLLDQMAAVQGECRTIKRSISEKVYTTRTDILDQFCEEESK